MREGSTKILVIDNYDSFVYNLVQYVGEVADEVIVRRNDALTLETVRDLDPTGIVVSPGPGTPAEAGISIPLFADLERPILGVCLGHQALCAANGAPVVHAPDVVHGKPSVIEHAGEGLFQHLPERIQVGRYHSLAVERDALPDALVETASTADERDVLMAVRHRERPHIGVQFHPESILTREAGGGNVTEGADMTDGTGGSDGTNGTDGTDGTASGSVEADTSSGERISLEMGKTMIRNFCTLAVDHAGRGA